MAETQQQFVLKQELLMTLVETNLDNPDVRFTEPLVPLSWNEAGLLTFEEIRMTPSQLRLSQLITGRGIRLQGWSQERRKQIADELTVRLNALSHFGCREVIVSGEFVEQIAEPVAADGYFKVSGEHFGPAQLRDYLQTITPALSWEFGRYSTELVQLQPVFCFKDALKDVEILPAPMTRYHLSGEGLPKGVVKVAYY